MTELKFEVEVFNPQKAELQEVVNTTKDITADPKTITKEELVVVSDARKKLMRFRTSIADCGKGARVDALKYQKDVIAYEKELVAVIEPEEKRLKEIEEAVKIHNIREVRREKLDEFKERLKEVQPDIVIVENTLLDMDPNELEAYYNSVVAKKNEDDRVAQEEKDVIAAEQKVKEEKAKQEEADKEAAKVEAAQEAKQKELDDKQKEVDDAAKKVEDDKKQLERDKELEEAKKEAQIQAQKDEKEKADRIAKEKEEAKQEEILQAEKAKKEQEADEKYQKWLLEHDFDKTKDIITKSVETNEIILYREISRFKVDHD